MIMSTPSFSIFDKTQASGRTCVSRARSVGKAYIRFCQNGVR